MIREHDTPPTTWPGNESVFPLGDDQYADWETQSGTAARVGLMTWHWNAADEHWCGGWIGFTNVPGHLARSKHELVCQDPLTVVPSLLCPHCGNHGWITGGKWIEA